MPRAAPPLVLAAFAAFAAALPAQAPLAAQGQPAAAFDRTPSDAAAVGFLTSVVDPRVYSLESVGAVKLRSKVTATFEVTDPLKKQPPTRVDLDLEFDYATGAARLEPKVAPRPEQAALVEQAKAGAQNAFSLKPSRLLATWRATFHQEGELVRLDYAPRTTGVIEGFSEWHRLDGTPLKRRTTSYVPRDGVLASVTQEVALDHVEAGKRLLLAELRPIETDGRQFGYRFEYAERDGLQLLRRLVQEGSGWRLTLEFDSVVERAQER